MLSGVGVICFAASYFVAFALELTRFFFRSGLRGAVLLGFAGAGLLAHTAFLWHSFASAAGSPLSSQRDWYYLAAWALAVLYLYLTYFHPKAPFGLFILPLVLGLIGVGRFLANPQPFARAAASEVWGSIHGVALLLTVVAVLAGFATGLMYFVQARRLKSKRPPTRGPQLPSLEWLQQAGGRSMLLSTMFLTAGIVAGRMLVAVNSGEHVPWNDPVVLATYGLFIWLLGEVVVEALYKPARGGRKAAFRTLISFVFLLVVLAVMLFSNSNHGGGGL